MKLKSTFILVSLLCASLAFAGAEGGGGGDAVVLPNGEVVLADVFLDRNQPQPNNMPRRISLNPVLLLQIKTYNEFLKRQLNVTNFFPNKSKAPEVVTLFNELGTRETKIVFYAVQDVAELNTYCASGGRKAYVLPNGSTVTQVACTSGDEVFLVESIFRKMSLLQQALLLMHERMTTLRDQYGGKNYGAIAGITSGLGELLGQAYKQQQGKLEVLSDIEQTRIHHFYQGLVELEYRNTEVPMDALAWSIFPNGGGFLKSGAEVDATSFISVTSSVQKDSIIGAQTKIIDSVIGSNVVIDSHAIISNSNLSSGTQISENVEVKKSTFIGSSIKIKSGSKIVGSTLQIDSFDSGSNFQMLNSIIDLKTVEIVPYTWRKKSKTYGEVRLNEGQKLFNGYIGQSFENFVPMGVELNFPSLNLAIKTECQEPLKNYRKRTSQPNCVDVTSLNAGRYGQQYFKPLITNTAGVELKADTFIETYIDKTTPWEADIKYEVLRSYQLALSFSSKAIEAKANDFIFYQGRIEKKGQSRIRSIDFNKNWKQGPEMLQKLTESLQAFGVTIQSEKSLGSEYLNTLEFTLQPKL